MIFKLKLHKHWIKKWEILWIIELVWIHQFNNSINQTFQSNLMNGNLDPIQVEFYFLKRRLSSFYFSLFQSMVIRKISLLVVISVQTILKIILKLWLCINHYDNQNGMLLHLIVESWLQLIDIFIYFFLILTDINFVLDKI